jgi:hypothetical protein
MKFLNAIVSFMALGFLILVGTGAYNLIIGRGFPGEALQYMGYGSFGFIVMLVCSVVLLVAEQKGMGE